MLVKIVRMSGNISIVGGLLCLTVDLIFFKMTHLYMFTYSLANKIEYFIIRTFRRRNKNKNVRSDKIVNFIRSI